jgi:hypothetical protein
MGGYNEQEVETVGRVAWSGSHATACTVCLCAFCASFCGQLSSSPQKAQKPQKRRHHCVVIRVRFGRFPTLRLGVTATRRLTLFTQDVRRF